MLGEYISEGGLDPEFELHREQDETKETFDARMALNADKQEGRVLYSSQVREGFYGEIDFRKRSLIGSMRLVLSLYRLPGEAQRIDRLMEALATCWHEQNPHEDGDLMNPFATCDAAFVFSFSTIMLNTDLHNNQVENKMTLDCFCRNNRGTNDGKDVPREYQEKVYNEIKNDKLKMQDAVTDIADDDFQWQKAVDQSRVKGGTIGSLASHASREYDNYLFSILVNPAISALKSVTEAIDADAGGEVTVNNAMEGFYLCSVMASYFSMTKVVDKIILALLRFTTPLDPHQGPASVRSLGKNSTGLLAVKVLFRVIKNHGDCMRESWTKVIDLVKRIFLLECLPEQRKAKQLFQQQKSAGRHYEKATHAASMTVKHANHPGVTHTGSLPSAPPPPLYTDIPNRSRAGDIPTVRSSFYTSAVSPLLYEPDPSIIHGREEDDGRAAQGWGFFSSMTEVENEAAQARAATSRVWDVVEACGITDLLERGVVGFSDEVLHCIIKAVIDSSGATSSPNTNRATGQPPSESELLIATPSELRSAVFAVHRVADLLIANGLCFYLLLL